MSDFIPGIFSYCDQWCARCPLAERCAVFAGSAVLDALDLDPAKPDYWQKMMEQFYEAHPEFPRDAIEAIEVRPPTAAEVERYERDYAEAQAYLQAQPLFVEAGALAERLTAFVNDIDYWRGRARLFAEKASMGIISVAECFADCDRVSAQEHTVRWYTGVLTERLKDALMHTRNRPGSEGAVQSEANGLCKVALLAIDEIAGALGAYLQLTGDEDLLLPLLSATGQLRRSVLGAFPLAPQFVRPGFDEVVVAMAVPG